MIRNLSCFTRTQGRLFVGPEFFGWAEWVGFFFSGSKGGPDFFYAVKGGDKNFPHSFYWKFSIPFFNAKHLNFSISQWYMSVKVVL